MKNKSQLYWHIQHLDQLGGTEMVSVDIMNHLLDDFNITCIVTAKIVEGIKYDLDSRIKVFCLNIPQDVTRMDAYFAKNKKEKKSYKNVFLIFKTLWYFILGRFHYRRVIKKLIEKNPGKLISSSGDSYLFAPRKVYSIFHFHFEYKNYFSFGNRFILAHSRKPNESLFLTKATLDMVMKKQKPKYKISFLYNPIRISRILNTTYHKNSIVFIGRFVEQKNPLLALQVANELKNRDFKFNLEFVGNGPLKEVMLKYVDDNNLSDVVTISGETNNVKEKLLQKDLLLITSSQEGFVLVKGEANACSVPCISSDFGSSVNEMFEIGKDGYVIESSLPKDFANKIIEILSNKEKLAKLKESSYERSKLLSYDVIIPYWKKILNW